MLEGSTMSHVTFDSILEDLRDAVAKGGSGADFLRGAYLSWYRSSNPAVSLYNFDHLDRRNRELFFSMLEMRNTDDFSDDALYQLEQDFKRQL